jgi:hypothetical protein
MKKRFSFFSFLLFQSMLLNAQDWQLVTSPYPTADTFVAAYNVKDYGAKGDGVTDDTKAIQDVLDKLKFGKSITNKEYNAGGVVYIPEGKYVIKETIIIPKGVTLRGDWEKPEKGSPIKGTILMSYVGKYSTGSTPLLMLSNTCAVMDLAIWYPEQNPDDVTVYSPAICLGSNTDGWDCQSMTARNITLVNAYEGVVYQRKYPDGGASPCVYNIYGTPLHTGVEIDCISDVGRIEWIHFSPDYWSGSGLPGSPQKGSAFEKYIYDNATGILMMKNDWSYTCFVDVEGYKIGFHSSKSANSGVRGPNGHNYSMTFRNCKNGVYFSGIANSGIMFTRIKTENCENGFAIDALQEQSTINLVHIDNCDIHATKNAIISDKASKAYIILHQTKVRNGAVNIKSGSFSSTDADYTNEFPHLAIGSNARVILTGNRFTDPAQISNNSLFECKIDHTPVNLPEMPAFPRIHPEEQKQKPARDVFYLATEAPFYAKGDAVTDNTTAIQAALDKAGQDGGGVVFLPPGKYKVTGHLVVPTGVELKGSVDLRSTPNTPGSTLEAYADKNNENGEPFLKLSEGSGIRGLVFNYPEQISGNIPNPAKYPYTIQGLGKDIYIVNIGIRGVYKGVDLFTHKCDNHYVDFLAGHALVEGLKVGGDSENGLICNLQFNVISFATGYQYKFGSWPNSTTGDGGAANAATYKFNLDYMDFMVVDDCKDLVLYNNFVYGSQRGTVFTSSTGKGASGIAMGHAVDGARRAFCFESLAPEGFNFINSQIVALRENANDQTAFIETTSSFDGKGKATLFSCNYWGNATRALNLNGGTLDLYLSNFVNTGESGFAKISNNAYLNMVNSVVRPRNPLLSGNLTHVSVKSSFTNNDGISVSNVGVWTNNLTFNPIFQPGAAANRSHWIASASKNVSDAAKAIDSTPSTRWTSGNQSENNGAWFSVDMIDSWKFNKIVMEHTQSANDFPESFTVYVSNDGVNWGEPVYSATGSGGGLTSCEFENQIARYIKVVLNAVSKTQYWSIHEFYVLYDESLNETGIPVISKERDRNNDINKGSVSIKNGQLHVTGYASSASIIIYDLTGQVVANYKTISENNPVNLPFGIYLVKIQEGKNQTITKLIVK